MSELPLMLIMQAYERLITFTERSSFKALLERFPARTLDATQLFAVYREAIRTEYEHNLSQQIYVPEGIWQAVSDMKEQQIFILEQLSGTLPPNSPGTLLEHAILHFQASDANASMQPIVLEAIRNAAKKQIAG
jgi:hypothetical protein